MYIIQPQQVQHNRHALLLTPQVTSAIPSLSYTAKRTAAADHRPACLCGTCGAPSLALMLHAAPNVGGRRVWWPHHQWCTLMYTSVRQYYITEFQYMSLNFQYSSYSITVHTKGPYPAPFTTILRYQKIYVLGMFWFGSLYLFSGRHCKKSHAASDETEILNRGCSHSLPWSKAVRNCKFFLTVACDKLTAPGQTHTLLVTISLCNSISLYTGKGWFQL